MCIFHVKERRRFNELCCYNIHEIILRIYRVVISQISFLTSALSQVWLFLLILHNFIAAATFVLNQTPCMRITSIRIIN